MAKPLQVTVFDPETGTTETGTVDPGNYMILCVEPCYLAGAHNHANGTTVLTIKGRAANLMSVKEVGGA